MPESVSWWSGGPLPIGPPAGIDIARSICMDGSHFFLGQCLDSFLVVGRLY